MGFRTLDQAPAKGKRTLLRLDLNVPMEAGRVTDATRIERALPTLNDLIKLGAKVIVLSHFDGLAAVAFKDLQTHPTFNIITIGKLRIFLSHYLT